MIAPGIDSLGYSSTSRLGSACDDILTRSLLASSSSRRSTLLRGTADFSSIFASSPKTLCYYIPYTYCRCSPSHPVSRKQARTLSALWLFFALWLPGLSRCYRHHPGPPRLRAASLRFWTGSSLLHRTVTPLSCWLFCLSDRLAEAVSSTSSIHLNYYYYYYSLDRGQKENLNINRLMPNYITFLIW